MAIRATRAMQRALRINGRNKFHAKRTETVDGITHDSKKEAGRWMDLKNLQKAGLISGLTRQVKYPLEIDGVLIATYVADARYLNETGQLVIEDTKSPPTRKRRDYIMKRKLMRALYSIEIREV